LAAAFAEFAAHGVAGARVDRIAAQAGCNKNLIYVYFSDKEQLFTTVLYAQLEHVHRTLPFAPDDVPGYATRIFEYATANPDVMRLLAWAGLERKTEGVVRRRPRFDEKVVAMRKLQADGSLGDLIPPQPLLTMATAIATAWSAANPFGSLLDPITAKNPSRLRSLVHAVVELLATANASDGDRASKAPKRRRAPQGAQ
jgi:AcrR family transcriptional regulator